MWHPRRIVFGFRILPSPSPVGSSQTNYQGYLSAAKEHIIDVSDALSQDLSPLSNAQMKNFLKRANIKLVKEKDVWNR